MYIDTQDLKEIETMLKAGIIKGVTTNPTILKKGKLKRKDQIKNIFNLGVKELFVQLTGTTKDEFYKDYLELKKIETDIKKEIFLKVPLTFEGIKAIKLIKENNPNKIILGTAIYSADQAILGAICGCDYLAPYVNRMKNNSINPITEIEKIKKFIDQRNLKTIILAASFKNTEQIIDSLMAGAHTCTITYDLLKQMLDKELALNAVEVFNKDSQKYN